MENCKQFNAQEIRNMYEIARRKKNTQDFIKKIFNQIKTNSQNLNEFTQRFM